MIKGLKRTENFTKNKTNDGKKIVLGGGGKKERNPMVRGGYLKKDWWGKGPFQKRKKRGNETRKKTKQKPRTFEIKGPGIQSLEEKVQNSRKVHRSKKKGLERAKLRQRGGRGAKGQRLCKKNGSQ